MQSKKHLSLFCAVLLTTLACGGAPATGDAGPQPPTCDAAKQGFTTCGQLTECQPGQYCQAGAFCENGCLSDVNCACNQFCASDGVCTNKQPPPDAGPVKPPPDASLQRCQRACEAAGECNYFSPVEVVSCKDSCESQLGVELRKALAACVERNTGAGCQAGLPACFDESCSTGVFTCCGVGAPYTCGPGDQCVGHICL